MPCPDRKNSWDLIDEMYGAHFLIVSVASNTDSGDLFVFFDTA